MLIKLLVVTFACVTARNVYKDNIRDISLPEPKLDFETSYENTGTLPEYYRHNARTEHSKVVPDRKRRPVYKHENDQEKLNNNRSEAVERNEGQANDKRKIYEPQNNSQNEETDLKASHPDNRGLSQDNESVRGSDTVGDQNKKQVNHENTENDRKITKNYHQNRHLHNHHSNHRDNSGNNPELGSDFIQSYDVNINAQKQNKEGLNHQIKENERHLDEISRANRDRFDSERQTTSNQRNIMDVEGIGNSSPNFQRQVLQTNPGHLQNGRHHHSNQGYTENNFRESIIEPHHQHLPKKGSDEQNRRNLSHDRKHEGSTAPEGKGEESKYYNANENAQANFPNPEPRNREDLTTKEKEHKDNEVEEKDTEEKWIWADTTTTTTPKTNSTVGVEDRASFVGDKCPTGKVKVNGMCAEVD